MTFLSKKNLFLNRNPGAFQSPKQFVEAVAEVVRVYKTALKMTTNIGILALNKYIEF